VNAAFETLNARIPSFSIHALIAQLVPSLPTPPGDRNIPKKNSSLNGLLRGTWGRWPREVCKEFRWSRRASSAEYVYDDALLISTLSEGIPPDATAATDFNVLTGLVTDYGSSMVQWMRTRRPRYRGEHRMEMERPSASFTVDVSVSREKCALTWRWLDSRDKD
jgi:hypothetical protein